MPSPMRVLVIDREPGIRDILEELLVEEGYQVTLRERIDLAEVEALSPACLILDPFHLAPRWGMATLESLRVRFPRLPLLVLTANALRAGEQASALLGLGVRVVHKPFDIDDLTREVDALCPTPDLLIA